MRPGRFLLATCLVAAAAGLGAQSAIAARSPLSDCNAHNALTHHYSVAQLRHALATMPAEVREYTACYQIINDQMLRQLGQRIPGSSGGDSNSSGGSLISTPLLIVLIVIVVGGGGAALAAYRRRP